MPLRVLHVASFIAVIAGFWDSSVVVFDTDTVDFAMGYYLLVGLIEAGVG